MKQWILTVLIGIVLSGGSVLVYDRYFAQKIVALDLKTYKAEQRKRYLAGEMSDDDLKKEIERFERLLNDIPNNKVVVLADTVLKIDEIVHP
ncbi:MAG: hypothetical protein WAO55_13795 [Candidatus Manganitrophaceae bacterium]